MLRIFATFLKKGSAKNFQSGNVLNNILRSTDEPSMFALHPRVKVLVKLFQKLAGLGRAHKTAFLFATFLKKGFFSAKKLIFSAYPIQLEARKA